MGASLNFIFLAVGITGLVVTGLLALAREKTLSQRAQALLPRWVDWIVGISGMVLLCIIKHYHPEFDFSLSVFWSGFWGHIWIANKERYEG